MAGKKQIYYKAGVLLVVFSLHTAVSFACSFSSLFHQFHHNSPVVSKHKEHAHSHSSSHGHQAPGHTHEGEHHHTGSSQPPKEDCCSASIIEVEKMDKAVSRNIELPLVISFPLLFPFIASSLFDYKATQRLFSPYGRWRHPLTIQNLRIIIQSFQI